MAGLVRAKKYDWKDSNLSLFGSDLERKVKKAAAETEEAWQGAGQEVGLQIWRIVKFKVTHWPKEDYGKFYDSDSYVILNTYKEKNSEELLYDVHFWIGQYSTQDEYGTAAYKTVELDTLLNDKPIQHREVMNFESDLFLSYFKTIELLSGGAESGFRHVGPKEYKPRLLHFHGLKKNIEVKEVPLNQACLVSADVFILDLGEKIYLWNGREANKDERFKAVTYAQKIKAERGKCTTETLDERDISKSHAFYSYLSTDPLEDMKEEAEEAFHSCLFRLSDESGKMEFSLVEEGTIHRSQLDPNDVFILDTGKACYVWIGNQASKGERKNAMAYAHNYLQKTKHPLIPVTCLAQGSKNKDFESALA